MHFGPILRALWRNKVGALLIALQIAFTLTVCLNALVMIQERLGNIARPSGLVEDDLFHLTSSGYGEGFDGLATATDDLNLLRRTPGIVNAVQINAVPLSGSGWSMGLQTEPGDDITGVGVAVYMVDEHGLDTMGLELIAGENFAPEDVDVREPAKQTWPAKAIVSRSTIESLYPDEAPADVVGRTVYISNHQPMLLVGVIERLQAPWSGASLVERAILVPERMAFDSSHLLIRTEPGRRDAMVADIEALLAEQPATRLLRDVRTMAETRELSYQLDNGLTRVLQIVMVVLLIITALGTLGLASFSVRRRTRQIGTRRALGATRGDILRYFLTENAVITGMGVLLGALLAVAFNLWLVQALEFPKLVWWYLPVGMLALLLLGQIAAWGPARRACAVSPAVATRTV